MSFNNDFFSAGNMPSSDDPLAVTAVPRKVLPLIFVIDTSGSMDGDKIAAVNTAIRESLTEIEAISHENADAQIKIGVLEFSSGVEWMYPDLTPAGQFTYQDLQASGGTSLGSAYTQLDQKLSRNNGGFMTEPTGTRAPAIILLSDGEPTDSYSGPLQKLKGNSWFKVAVKVAIAIGDDANRNVLIDFTGNAELVITAHDVPQLKKLIRTVSVTASTVASQSQSVGKSNGIGNATQADASLQVASTITNTIQTDPTLQGVDQGTSTANAGTDDWDF